MLNIARLRFVEGADVLGILGQRRQSFILPIRDHRLLRVAVEFNELELWVVSQFEFRLPGQMQTVGVAAQIFPEAVIRQLRELIFGDGDWRPDGAFR